MNLSGQLLIAPPTLRGNFWHKSVIFVTENHNKGSMGILLNRNSKNTISEFTRQVGIECDVPGYLYIGGPVNTKAVTILHSSDWRCQNTLEINNEFSLSSQADIIQRLAMGDRPRYWRLFLGLCAWSPEQLEFELKGKHPYSHENSWLVATPNYHNVFNLDSTEQWTHAVECSGTEFVQKLLD